MIIALIVTVLIVSAYCLAGAILYIRTQDRKARIAMRLREAIENDYPVATAERMLAIRNAMRTTIENRRIQ